MTDTGHLETLLDAVLKQLRQRRFDVRAAGTTLHIERPSKGRKKPPVEVTLDTVLAATADLDDAALRRWASSFAEGIAVTIGAPKGIMMDELNFTTAAGRLVMRIEGPGFLDGVRLAGGDALVHQAWQDDMVLVYYLELDRGMRPITQTRFEAWDVTFDQIHCGARSILHHKSRYGGPVAVEGFEGVEQYALGDGFDAARAVILGDLDWYRAQGGLALAVPEPGRVLFSDVTADGDVPGALKDAAEQYYAAATYPLSGQVYRLKGDALEPVG